MVMAVLKHKSPRIIILSQSWCDAGHTSAYFLEPGHVISSQPCCSCNIPMYAWVCHQAECSADTSHGTAPARKHLMHNREASLPCTTKSPNIWLPLSSIGRYAATPGTAGCARAPGARQARLRCQAAAPGRPQARRGAAGAAAHPRGSERAAAPERAAPPARSARSRTPAAHPVAHDVCVQRTLNCLLHCRQKCI